MHTSGDVNRLDGVMGHYALRGSAPGYVSKEQTIIPYTETIDRTITLVPTGR